MQEHVIARRIKNDMPNGPHYVFPTSLPALHETLAVIIPDLYAACCLLHAYPLPRHAQVPPLKIPVSSSMLSDPDTNISPNTHPPLHPFLFLRQHGEQTIIDDNDCRPHHGLEPNGLIRSVLALAIVGTHHEAAGLGCPGPVATHSKYAGMYIISCHPLPCQCQILPKSLQMMRASILGRYERGGGNAIISRQCEDSIPPGFHVCVQGP